MKAHSPNRSKTVKCPKCGKPGSYQELRRHYGRKVYGPYAQVVHETSCYLGPVAGLQQNMKEKAE